MATNSSTFCIMPFTHIVTKTNGEFKLCCRSTPLYSVKDMGLFDVWNSEKFKRIRKQLLNSERPKECDSCWKLEDANVSSMRHRENSLKCVYGDYLKLLENLNDDYSMKTNPVSLELKLNNLCNLQCRMCHPADSTKWAKDWPLIADLQKHNEWTYRNVKEYNLVEHPYLCEWENHPTFFDDIRKLANGLDTVWFAGGEPLIDPMHYKILDVLAEENNNIKLQYATNLTKITFRKKHIMDYWRKFKGVLVGVSLDGLRDVFEYIRIHASFDSVVDNINTIRDMAEEEGLDIRLFTSCTFQIYNIFDLPEIFEFMLDNDIWIHSHRVTFPKYLSCQIIPKELKEPLTEKLQKYSDKSRYRPDLDVVVRKNLVRHINDNMNFLNGDDLSRYMPDFIKFSKLIDKSAGGKSLLDIRPEFGDYI